MDTIIIGGGIAGLFVAEALAKAGVSVTVLERYPAWGGRIVTHRDDGLQYEIGAGRIANTHKRVSTLIHRFHLTTFPISSESNYESEPNDFQVLFDPILSLLTKLPVSLLAGHTIGELMPTEFHPILRRCPYWAEIHMMRADVAAPLFARGGLMRDATFYGIREGLDAITTRLAEASRAAGATLLNRHRVADVRRRPDGTFDVTGDFGKKAEARPFHYVARRVIFATCRCSLSDFSVLRGAPVLKQTGTSPLVRVYAVYPPHRGEGAQGAWFADLPKTVTDGPLRYVIPIDPKSGLIMISYTDGEDTTVWSSGTDAAFEERLDREVRRAFPDRDIPKPTYVARHVWPSGCTYWLPGDYDPAKASAAALNPAKNVYICGESISMQQAWIEGALESAESLITLFRPMNI